MFVFENARNPWDNHISIHLRHVLSELLYVLILRIEARGRLLLLLSHIEEVLV